MPSTLFSFTYFKPSYQGNGDVCQNPDLILRRWKHKESSLKHTQVESRATWLWPFTFKTQMANKLSGKPLKQLVCCLWCFCWVLIIVSTDTKQPRPADAIVSWLDSSWGILWHAQHQSTIGLGWRIPFYLAVKAVQKDNRKEWVSQVWMVLHGWKWCWPFGFNNQMKTTHSCAWTTL